MATQKVPLTRLDDEGASEGNVLKYSSGGLAWLEDDLTGGGGGGGGGSGTAFKNTVLGTESVSANSLEQYQVHSGLEILSGGTFTIAASGDLVLDAPDDPHKAAGWTDSGNVIHTTDSLNKIVIGQTTALSADDMLSVAGGNVTVAGSVSAQGDVYGNARTLTNPGVILQRKIYQYDGSHITTSSTAKFAVNIGLSAAFTPLFNDSHIHLKLANMQVHGSTYGGAIWLGRDDSQRGFKEMIGDQLGDSSGEAMWDGNGYSNMYYQGNMTSIEVIDRLIGYTSGSITYAASGASYSSSSTAKFHPSGVSGGRIRGSLVIEEVAAGGSKYFEVPS